MAAPGLKTSDFKVSINRKILTISCLHKEGECEKKVYRQQEFNFRCFKKRLLCLKM
jgi:HSP20 family molecular chaperone IbpA